MASSSPAVRLLALLLLSTLSYYSTAALDSGRPGRRLLAQREGIFLNTEDVAVVQKKADKDAAAQKAAAIVKYQSHPHKSGWSKFMSSSSSSKDEWNKKRADAAGSNPRKARGYGAFTSKSMEAQRRWHALNARALGKGQISKLPGQVDQPYRGKEYKKNEGAGITIRKTDRDGKIRTL